MWVVTKRKRDCMATEAPSSSESLLHKGGNLQDQTVPQTDVTGIVFSGIFGSNTLDFANKETATRIHFTLPEKKNSYKDNSCM